MIENCTLVNFIDLNLDEKKMILSWRNDIAVRKWMYTQEEILLESHLAFIDALRGNETKKYFLVEQNNQYIGVINFINISKESLEMGIYANPNKRGIGKLLLSLIIKYSFDVIKTKKIIAEVFCENVKAYNLYKSLNFEKFSKRVVNGKNVYCLELKDENR